MKPSQRREVALKVREEISVTIRIACIAKIISERCYRYQAKLSGENAVIADWLLGLTQEHRPWGWTLLSVSSQRKALRLESQTRVPNL